MVFPDVCHVLIIEFFLPDAREESLSQSGRIVFCEIQDDVYGIIHCQSIFVFKATLINGKKIIVKGSNENSKEGFRTSGFFTIV